MSQLSSPDSSALRLDVIAGFMAAAVILPRAMAYATVGVDKYNRTLADVFLPNGTHVKHKLVKRGGAGGTGSMRRRIPCWRSWRIRVAEVTR